MNTRAARLWPCLVLAACAPETIIVAYGPDAADELDASEAGANDAGEDADARAPRDASYSDAFGPPRGCLDDKECKPDENCLRMGCNDARGSCVHLSLCNAEQYPVCGCDGITYFNDCWRQQAGTGRRYERACDQDDAMHCHPFLPCGSGARCEMLLFNRSCDPANFAAGKCWVIPDCTFIRGGPRFQSCGAQGEHQCVTACQAIESEVPHTTMGCSDGPPRP